MTYADSIEGHYRRNWSTPIDRVRWGKGPISDLPSDFRVLVVPRSDDMLAYATCCMSQLDDPERIELHVLTRKSAQTSDEVIEALTAVAHYHRTAQKLGLGHSVNFGRPLVSGSTCSHGLISLPYLDGPDLEWMPEESRVRFLWLVPVTAAEVAFKKRQGLEALEQAFESTQFDFLDPFRPSVV